MFQYQKADADIDYMSRKLDAEFEDKAEEDGHAKGEEKVQGCITVFSLSVVKNENNIQ